MKIYEKPMAIVNKFEVADVIAASTLDTTEVSAIVNSTTTVDTATTQGVLFQW